jgi:hypothetical protein
MRVKILARPPRRRHSLLPEEVAASSVGNAGVFLGNLREYFEVRDQIIII